MPRDPSNIPQARSAPFRHNDPSHQEDSSGNRLNATLSLENLLLEEFNQADEEKLIKGIEQELDILPANQQ